MRKRIINCSNRREETNKGKWRREVECKVQVWKKKQKNKMGRKIFSKSEENQEMEHTRTIVKHN